jgi:hypothetical protein
MVINTRSKVLIAVAVAVLGYVIVTTPDPEAPASAAAAPRARGAAAGAGFGTGAGAGTAASTGSARRAAPATAERAGDLLDRMARRVADAKAATVLFGRHSWYVAPPPPPPPPPPVYVAPPPPQAPPLPFSVMGSYARTGDSTVFFLTRGDRVFDVRVGDTIDGTYSVDGAANGLLTLTYKPLNIPQTLPIGDSN